MFIGKLPRHHQLVGSRVLVFANRYWTLEGVWSVIVCIMCDGQDSCQNVFIFYFMFEHEELVSFVKATFTADKLHHID